MPVSQTWRKTDHLKNPYSGGLSCDLPLIFQFNVLLLITFTKFTFDEYQMFYYYLYQNLIISHDAFPVQMFFSILQLYQKVLDVCNQNGVGNRKHTNKIHISETLN